MKRIWLAYLIPAAFVFAWWAGYTFYADDAPKNQRTTASDVDVDLSAAPQDDPDAQVDNDVLSDNAPDNLTYLGWDVDNTADEPRVCFNFLTALNDADTIKVRDYIRTSPEASISAQISGQDLCMTGFAFD